MIEVYGDDEATKVAMEYVATTPVAPDLAEANGLLILTLTGSSEVDLDLVTTLDQTARPLAPCRGGMSSIPCRDPAHVATGARSP